MQDKKWYLTDNLRNYNIYIGIQHNRQSTWSRTLSTNVVLASLLQLHQLCLNWSQMVHFLDFEDTNFVTAITLLERNKDELFRRWPPWPHPFVRTLARFGICMESLIYSLNLEIDVIGSKAVSHALGLVTNPSKFLVIVFKTTYTSSLSLCAMLIIVSNILWRRLSWWYSQIDASKESFGWIYSPSIHNKFLRKPHHDCWQMQLSDDKECIRIWTCDVKNGNNYIHLETHKITNLQ